jgi:hypothetical protein
VLVFLLLTLALFEFLLFLLLEFLIVLEELVGETLSTGIKVLCQLLFEVSHTLYMVIVVITGTDGSLLKELFGVLLILVN